MNREPTVVTRNQILTIEHIVGMLIEEVSAYSGRLATLPLTDEERKTLLVTSKKKKLERVMKEIEKELGGWEIVRDPAEAACP